VDGERGNGAAHPDHRGLDGVWHRPRDEHPADEAAEERLLLRRRQPTARPPRRQGVPQIAQLRAEHGVECLDGRPPGEALRRFACLADRAQGQFPAPLNLRRHQPMLGIDRSILPFREACLILRTGDLVGVLLGEARMVVVLCGQNLVQQIQFGRCQGRKEGRNDRRIALCPVDVQAGRGTVGRGERGWTAPLLPDHEVSQLLRTR